MRDSNTTAATNTALSNTTTSRCITRLPGKPSLRRMQPPRLVQRLHPVRILRSPPFSPTPLCHPHTPSSVSADVPGPDTSPAAPRNNRSAQPDQSQTFSHSFSPSLGGVTRSKIWPGEAPLMSFKT